MKKDCIQLLHSLLTFTVVPGANSAGEGKGRAGDAEPAHSTTGEQLQGIGTLPGPVQ